VSENSIYPLVALVGQEEMVEALTLLALDPSIGGLLLLGEKGTAKSTAARALSEILPPFEAFPCPYHCRAGLPHLYCPECRISPKNPSIINPPFKTVPLGVTEERLLGGMDFELTMKEGRPVMRAGILGEANNGLLYIDEVNLLDPQLAHLILDASSSGKVSLERDGFSITHPARFALLGSMNPEEGPLGPQLMDRFAMGVQLKGVSEREKRAEIIRRRLAFEKDPIAFRAQYACVSAELRKKIERGYLLLPFLRLTDEALIRASQIAKSNGAQGHRADLALCLAARAKFALDTNTQEREIGPEWIDKVEHLVIPLRRKIDPHKRIKSEVTRVLIDPKNKLSDHSDEKSSYIITTDELPPEWNYENFDSDDKVALRIFQSGEVFNIITPKLAKEKGPKEQKGRRSFRESTKARGRAYKTTARRLGRPLSLSATLRAAAPHQRERLKDGQNNEKIVLKASDFREKVYRLKTGRLVLFLVDSSGSIGTLYRMEEAKAAAMSLLTDAYQKRDRVAIIAFYGTTAELLLPPTNSPDLAGRLLTSLPSGGKTPLSAALAMTHKLLRIERAKDPMISAFVILMTDGRPNIPLDPKNSPWKEVLNFADLLATDPSLHFLLIDTDRGAYNEFKLTKELAEHLNAPKISLEDLKEDRLENWLNSF
jgi:magnesium chelatase subunit D